METITASNGSPALADAIAFIECKVSSGLSFQRHVADNTSLPVQGLALGGGRRSHMVSCMHAS